MGKLPSQRLNPLYSSDNAGSWTLWATRELLFPLSGTYFPLLTYKRGLPAPCLLSMTPFPWEGLILSEVEIYSQRRTFSSRIERERRRRRREIERQRQRRNGNRLKTCNGRGCGLATFSYQQQRESWESWSGVKSEKKQQQLFFLFPTWFLWETLHPCNILLQLILPQSNWLL